MTLQIKFSNSNELTSHFSGRVLMLQLHQKLSRFGDCFVFHRFVFGSCHLNLSIVSMYNKNIASVSKWNNCKYIAITIFNTEKSYQQTRRNVPAEISVHVFLGVLSTAQFSRGLKAWLKGVFGAYEWLAISLARRPRTKWIFRQK